MTPAKVAKDIAKKATTPKGFQVCARSAPAQLPASTAFTPFTSGEPSSTSKTTSPRIAGACQTTNAAAPKSAASTKATSAMATRKAKPPSSLPPTASPTTSPMPSAMAEDEDDDALEAESATQLMEAPPPSKVPPAPRTTSAATEPPPRGSGRLETRSVTSTAFSTMEFLSRADSCRRCRP